ncbi:MAG: hypothetical protein E7393_04855 [Ruminococcaceae bacterium]|nr:hypothetical protein [Oscillospiraceae bacterium]
MNMTDSIYVRRIENGVVLQNILSGVFCRRTAGLELDNAGFSGGGQITVRIPQHLQPKVCLGDQICRQGDHFWYTVVEIRDNRVANSGISHWKVIGKR